MISNIIDLTLALHKAGEKAVLVTKDESVISTLKEHGKEIASKSGIKHLTVQKHDPSGVRKNFSVDYEGVEKVYGEKAVMIIGKIATLSPESIKNNTKDGVFKLEIGEDEYEINGDYLKEETVKPEGSEIFDFGKGYVFVESEEEDIVAEPAEVEEETEESEEKEDDVVSN